MATPAADEPVRAPSHALTLGAATLGTLFEWYDFFLYGALAAHIAAHFFSAVNETTGFIFALAGFAVGFLVRPLGALIFGRIGDQLGRKTTFLVTLVIMGLATVLIGLIPDYAAIGIAAPIILIVLRVLQGLALGGEFAGAVTYIAEHAPPRRRGLHIGFLGLSSMGGLLLSLLVIAAVRAATGVEAFAEWGWRIPFIISAVLLAISLWVRLKLGESPVFERLKAEGATSAEPLTEAFLRWKNLKWVLIMLAAIAGQAVMFYSTTFYVLFFLQKSAMLDTLEATLLLSVALVFGLIVSVLTGWLSDLVGQKPLVLCGYAAAVLLFFPLFGALISAANPERARALATAPIVVQTDQASCSLQFDPTGSNRFEATSCDIALAYLASVGANYTVRDAGKASQTQVSVGKQAILAPNPGALPTGQLKLQIAAFRADAKAMLAEAGYRSAANPAEINRPLTVSILVLLLVINMLVSTPIHAVLPEIFPARIRYSALALPQNLGNGWFGGLLPATAFAIVAATGNIFAGLWYPVIIAGGAFVICLLFLPETRGREL